MNYKLYIFVFLSFFSLAIYPQNKKQKQLQKKKDVLIQQIKDISALRQKQSKNKQIAYNEVQQIAQKIKAQEQLLSLTNQQANLIEQEIKDNSQKMSDLEQEIKSLKKEYSKVIRQSYKRQSSAKNYFLILLSSDTFIQGYRRLKHINHYMTQRKEQSEKILKKSNDLKYTNEYLSAQKKQKVLVIYDIQGQKQNLDKEKQHQETLISNIKKQEKDYDLQIKQKQQQALAIDSEIDRIVKLSIEEANRKKAELERKKTEKAAKVVQNSKKNDTKKTITPQKNYSNTVIELSDDARKLSQQFEAKKGNLPWPITKGSKLFGYGRYQDPIYPDIIHENTGVSLLASDDSDAISVFDGEVSKVMMIAGNKTVCIRHGDYISIYCNLSKVYVVSGQKIKENTPIGKIAVQDGEAIIKFILMKNSNKLNPELWLRNM